MKPLEGPEQIAGFDTMLREELEQLRLRREHVLGVKSEATGSDAIAQAHEFGALGIGLSGGGIRSATFNLGILQGLSSLGLLPYVDYLSTVSGGGFIGSWLHGVIKRPHKGEPRPAGIALNPEAHSDTFGDAEHNPLAFLRMYSNYLAPRPGLLSADSWLIAVIWLRNMVLNQLILIPALCAVILAIVLACVGLCGPQSNPHPILLSMACLFFFVVVAGANIRAIAEQEFPEMTRLPYPRSLLAAWPAVLAVLAAALSAFAAHWKLTNCNYYLGILFACFFGLYALLQGLGGFLECFKLRNPGRSWLGKSLGHFWMFLFPFVAAAVTVALVFSVFWCLNGQYENPASAVWGPPLLILAMSVGVIFHIGLMGSDFTDASREWLARVGAILSILCFGWVVVAGISLYGPFWISSLALHYGGAAVGALVTWAGATFAGLKFARSSNTNSTADKQAESPVKELIAQAAPVIFVLGLLIILSTAIHLGLAVQEKGGFEPWYKNYQKLLNPGDQNRSSAIHVTQEANSGQTVVNILVNSGNAKDIPTEQYSGWFRSLAPFVDNYAKTLSNISLGHPWLFLLFLLVPAGLLPLRFNINEFSLLHFYKNRLVRCYLGASNTKERKPNRFTGFDPKDDFPISSLLPTAAKPYYGPFAIVNTALNTNIGAEMGRQERKASSFVFTPLRSGFVPPQTRLDRAEVGATSKLDPNAFRLTEGYLYPKGPGIGTVTGISGSAANPNMGYHTSTAVAFLLTWFSVRLGWWAGNPRIHCVPKRQCPADRPGPLYSIKWLFQELLAQTTARSNYLNLSDGGHFENLGLYELVRRRCRYIIIGDGETDPDLNFESLGGAIRKCRADFDVEIDIDIDRIQRTNGLSTTHCVVGQVIYPEQTTETDHKFTTRGQIQTGKSRGWLLYFKASVTGDEPEDIKQFRSSNPVFPHDPILKQFFTESLFESYRRLGYHAVEKTFENVEHALPKLDCIFQDLAALWYPSSSSTAGTATKLADAYTTLINKIGSDPDLGFLDGEVNIGKSAAPKELTPQITLKVKFFMIELIQLMENVWSDFKLESLANRNNPNNAGWITVFQRWTSGDQFKSNWATESKNYNPLFQKFVREVQTLK